MPLAANPCGHIWIKNCKVLKSRKNPRLSESGVFLNFCQNFKIFCLTFERFDCIMLMVLLVYRSNKFCLSVQNIFLFIRCAYFRFLHHFR